MGFWLILHDSVCFFRLFFPNRLLIMQFLNSKPIEDSPLIKIEQLG